MIKIKYKFKIEEDVALKKGKLWGTVLKQRFGFPRTNLNLPGKYYDIMIKDDDYLTDKDGEKHYLKIGKIECRESELELKSKRYHQNNFHLNLIKFP